MVCDSRSFQATRGNLNMGIIAKQALESITMPEISVDPFGGEQYEGLGDAIPATLPSNLDFGSIPIDIIGEINDGSIGFNWVCKTCSNDSRTYETNCLTGYIRQPRSTKSSR